ncbi:MAG: CRISPR-associated endonuclease Cas2 [bacterium]|nr:CRISPR-associated endonuclease Cas2 [bacterium]MCX8095836.1 CRISPR-associated endonuclease Cas2 [Caldisericia bacterium]MDW8163245.1 CRISPR-associated endonuclease Cas2 [Candidatus Omnitrophota bacterium]
MFIVISYDIQDDKKRYKVSQILENYGTRVQYSVFECIIEEEQLKEIQEKTSNIIDKKNDSIRFYKICEGCLKKIEIIGIGEVTKDLDFYVV